MKIAILSDVHDNIMNLKKAIKIIYDENVKAIIFCGDLCTLFTAGVLAEVGIKTYLTKGNADSDLWGLSYQMGGKFELPPFDQDFGEVNFDKRRIAFSHYPNIAKTLFKTNYYDAVFYGHSHYFSYKKKSDRIYANPGAVCGMISGKLGQATFLIYDSQKNDAKMCKI